MSEQSEWFDDEFDQRLISDEDAAPTLEAFFSMRPGRRAWRFDSEAAPLQQPVYAREQNNVRVVLAMREEEGWTLITRDGECLPAGEIASWAPLIAALR